MTKKDYILIAKVLNRSFDVPLLDLHMWVVTEMAKKLREENPRFDADKFMKVCGFEKASGGAWGI